MNLIVANMLILYFGSRLTLTGPYTSERPVKRMEILTATGRQGNQLTGRLKCIGLTYRPRSTFPKLTNSACVDCKFSKLRAVENRAKN